MKLTPTTLDDIEQLTEWIAHDPYHFHQGQPEWWLGTDAMLAFCLQDDRGPLAYVRLDEEGDVLFPTQYVRIHTQFAPESVVSKKRLVVGMIWATKCLIQMYDQMGKKGLIFNSVSPSLVAFMEKNLKFQSVGNDDYRLDFEEQQ